MGKSAIVSRVVNLATGLPPCKRTRLTVRMSISKRQNFAPLRGAFSWARSVSQCRAMPYRMIPFALALFLSPVAFADIGYKRRFRPRRRSDRSTPESRPSSGNVRFLGLEVRSTSDSRRRWARSAKTGCDPERTFTGSNPARIWACDLQVMSVNVRNWHQAAVRATSPVRPLYPREPTFERQRPLSWSGGPFYLGQPMLLGEVRQDRL